MFATLLFCFTGFLHAGFRVACLIGVLDCMTSTWGVFGFLSLLTNICQSWTCRNRQGAPYDTVYIW